MVLLTDFKERFLALYKENITRDGADDLMEWLTTSDFFVAPASTMFHGSHAGGLLEHSLNVYDCLVEELDILDIKDNYSAETVALVSLLHDICKVNFYKKGTRNVKENGQWVTKEVYEIDEKFPCGHGEKSVIILQNFMNLSAEEIFAIRAHMGDLTLPLREGTILSAKSLREVSYPFFSILLI